MQAVTAQKLEVRTRIKLLPLKASEKIVMRLEGLRKAFGGQVVLDEISLELRRGEVVLLRGDNGSGKTTLLNILTGNLEPDAGTIQLFTNGLEENLHFPRPWWKSLNPFNHFTPERMSWEGVGRTWQEIRLFPSLNLSDNIALATPDQLGENPAWVLLRRQAMKKQERKLSYTSQAMLVELGLKGRETSSADKVSLGQSKRVAIARAVQAGARILFLDEPLAGLDAPGIAEVMNLLEKLAHSNKVTLVIVEHVFNISRILDLATSVWTLKDGKVTIETPAQVCAKMEHTGGDGVRGWIKQMAGSNGKIVNQKLPGGALLSKAIPLGGDLDSSVLEVEDLVVHRGRRLVIGNQRPDGCVEGLSFTVRLGELAFLQAPNGWGKTTLLEAIAGIIPVTCGTIRLNGKSIQDLPPWERARLGMSFLQARNHTFPGLTVQEGLRLAHVTEIPQNITHLLERRMSGLSGGEKQKAAMTCALNGESFTVGLLDEPFSALDPAAISHLCHSVNQRLKDRCVLVAIPRKPLSD